MKKIKRLLLLLVLTGAGTAAHAQLDESGISAGFFDSSENNTLNFSTFHLPPLSVLYENAKQNPQILSLAKAQELAQAEVAKQKRHIFSYVTGHASYSYGKADMWGNSSSAYSPTLYQFQGTEQSYWNVGVNVAVPLEDILDLSAAVKRKRIEAEQAKLKKDIEFEDLKKEIGILYVTITNNLVTLKTASESAAAYQGAGSLNQEDFHQGNMTMESYAYTKMHELSVVQQYQTLQTKLMTDIITLEILSRTPIITNATTDVTLDDTIQKSDKQIAKENKAVDKRIAEEVKNEEKRYRQLEKAEREAQKKAEREAAKNNKKK